MSGLRLNLGCGLNRRAGYVNVDREGDPDLRHDLEVFPWPWPDDSVSEVLLFHVLEHLGRDPNVYLAIMKELYRVCRDGAWIWVVVPHHRHDHFYHDPTHVRAVTIEGMKLFSQRVNRQWAAEGFANTPLALYLGIDFELVEVKLKPSALWRCLHANSQHQIDAETLLRQSELYNNMIQEVEMMLRAVKPPGREPHSGAEKGSP
jgi:hypothetical protein